MTTRVFKRKGQKSSRSITLSLSFETAREARFVAWAVDRIKAAAAADGQSMSDRLGDMLWREALCEEVRLEHNTKDGNCWCKSFRVKP